MNSGDSVIELGLVALRSWTQAEYTFKKGDPGLWNISVSDVEYRMAAVPYRMSSIAWLLYHIGCRVSHFCCTISDVEYRMAAVPYRVSSISWLLYHIGCRVSHFCCTISDVEYRMAAVPYRMSSIAWLLYHIGCIFRSVDVLMPWAQVCCKFQTACHIEKGNFFYSSRVIFKYGSTVLIEEVWQSCG
jgi:hypothetical protein